MSGLHPTPRGTYLARPEDRDDYLAWRSGPTLRGTNRYRRQIGTLRAQEERQHEAIDLGTFLHVLAYEQLDRPATFQDEPIPRHRAKPKRKRVARIPAEPKRPPFELVSNPVWDPPQLDIIPPIPGYIAIRVTVHIGWIENDHTAHTSCRITAPSQGWFPVATDSSDAMVFPVCSSCVDHAYRAVSSTGAPLEASHAARDSLSAFHQFIESLR